METGRTSLFDCAISRGGMCVAVNNEMSVVVNSEMSVAVNYEMNEDESYPGILWTRYDMDRVWSTTAHRSIIPLAAPLKAYCFIPALLWLMSL